MHSSVVAVMAAFWCQVGAKLGPSWDQDGAKLSQDAAKLAELGAMMGPSWGQVGPKLEPSWAKLGPSCLLNATQEPLGAKIDKVPQHTHQICQNLTYLECAGCTKTIQKL